MSGLRRLWRDHRLLLLAFLAALAVTLFFGVRTIGFLIYWNDPRHQDQPLAGWMTPRYVAHSWDVPPEVIGTALGLEGPPKGGPVRLEELAAERGMTMAQLNDMLMTAIEAHRAND